MAVTTTYATFDIRQTVSPAVGRVHAASFVI